MSKRADLVSNITEAFIRVQCPRDMCFDYASLAVEHMELAGWTPPIEVLKNLGENHD